MVSDCSTIGDGTDHRSGDSWHPVDSNRNLRRPSYRNADHCDHCVRIRHDVLKLTSIECTHTSVVVSTHQVTTGRTIIVMIPQIVIAPILTVQFVRVVVAHIVPIVEHLLTTVIVRIFIIRTLATALVLMVRVAKPRLNMLPVVRFVRLKVFTRQMFHLVHRAALARIQHPVTVQLIVELMVAYGVGCRPDTARFVVRVLLTVVPRITAPFTACTLRGTSVQFLHTGATRHGYRVSMHLIGEIIRVRISTRYPAQTEYRHRKNHLQQAQTLPASSNHVVFCLFSNHFTQNRGSPITRTLVRH
uniref:Uncharacterized protein n=1 Tax=Anopheles funestus TaxID=62324 RepID=A0A4Y0BFJ4_ANOFN